MKGRFQQLRHILPQNSKVFTNRDIEEVCQFGAGYA
jgi:hypothetical protein